MTQTFASTDGTPLAYTLYEPEGEATCGVLISAGTGFPQRLYAKFAAYLASKGARVLTFDYRGIGGSRPENLAELHMDYADWGRMDQEAAVQFLASKCAGLPLYHVGHSVGGLHFGFVESHALISRHAFIGCGTGSFLRHHLWFLPAALTLWYLVGPWHLWRQGYIAKGRWWTGEDLPAGAYRDWRRWCHRLSYFESELDGPLSPHWFDKVEAPIQSWIFSDDPIANAKSAPRCLSLYQKAQSHLILREPYDIGAKKVGHSGMFSSKAIGFWPEVWDWLEKGRRPNNEDDMGEIERRDEDERDSAVQRAATDQFSIFPALK